MNSYSYLENNELFGNMMEGGDEEEEEEELPHYIMLTSWSSRLQLHMFNLIIMIFIVFS